MGYGRGPLQMCRLFLAAGGQSQEAVNRSLPTPRPVRTQIIPLCALEFLPFFFFHDHSPQGPQRVLGRQRTESESGSDVRVACKSRCHCPEWWLTQGSTERAPIHPPPAAPTLSPQSCTPFAVWKAPVCFSRPRVPLFRPLPDTQEECSWL